MLTSPIPFCCVYETSSLFAYRQSKEENLRNLNASRKASLHIWLEFCLCSCLIICPLTHIKISASVLYLLSGLVHQSHMKRSMFKYDWHGHIVWKYLVIHAPSVLGICWSQNNVGLSSVDTSHAMKSLAHKLSARLHLPAKTWSFCWVSVNILVPGSRFSSAGILHCELFSFAIHDTLGLATVRSHGTRQWLPVVHWESGTLYLQWKDKAGDLVATLKSVEIYCCELAASSLVLLLWRLATWIVCFSFCKCAQIGDVHSVHWKEAEEAGWKRK